MKIIESKQADYNEYVANNDDPYGSGVVLFAERWADMMESELANGKSVVEVAKETSHSADTEGITGFMYGCAVQSLAHFWEHGEELRKWHNLDCQLSDEGEKANSSGGVLNPAVMNVAVKG